MRWQTGHEPGALSTDKAGRRGWLFCAKVSPKEPLSCRHDEPATARLPKLLGSRKFPRNAYPIKAYRSCQDNRDFMAIPQTSRRAPFRSEPATARLPKLLGSRKFPRNAYPIKAYRSCQDNRDFMAIPQTSRRAPFTELLPEE